MTRRALPAIVTTAVWLALLGIWWLIAALQQGPGTLWPTPPQVAVTLWQLRGAFAQNTGVTAEEAALGFAAAVALAAAISLVSERHRSLAGSLHRLAIGVYSLPLIALAPALVLWTGSGLTTKVIIASLASFFPVLINLTQALRSTDPNALEMMRAAGASSWQVFRHVELPYALPALFAAFTVAAPAAILGAMLAEWVGANSGLGIQLLNSMQNGDIPQLYASLAVASLLSLTVWLVFTLAGRWLFPWHASQQRLDSERGQR
jgi:ABC-type nitrate/sulfonate/bicarbonate transport system permease component